MDQARIIISFKSVNPADISHGRIIPFYVKLVLETDGKAMKRANRATSCGEVFVQPLGSVQGLIEEDFMQTIVLGGNGVREACFHFDAELETSGSTVTHNLMSNRGCLAKGLSYLQGTILAVPEACHDCDSVLSNYFNLSGIEVLLNKWPGQVSLF